MLLESARRPSTVFERTAPLREFAHPGHSIEVEGVGRKFSVGIASGFDDYEQAFLLLSRKYRSRGYEPDGKKPFRFTPHHVLPETITVVARCGGEVLATLSMVPDTSLLGLPMESIFPDEIEHYRSQGRRLAEVTCLADEGLAHREFLNVFVAMIRLVQQYHLRAGGDTWVVAVNPRHGSFYRKALGAITLGSGQSYPSVQDAPAEAYLSDRELMKEHAPKMYHLVFDEPLPEAVLTPTARPADHIEFFGLHSTVADRIAIETVAWEVEKTSGPRFRWDKPNHAIPAPHASTNAPSRRPAA